MVEAQYPRALNSTAKKCTDQLFILIAGQSGSYFPNLVACHDSMFSSQRQVISKIITTFVVVEQKRISGLSCEITIAGGITCVDSRSDKRTYIWCTFQQSTVVFLEFLEVFGSLEPALTNFLYKNLVLETWYDVKKAFIDDAITRNTAS